MKKIRYLIEALLLYMLYGLFKLMPVKAASATGGWLGRAIGPHLAASRKAMTNLRQALPGKRDDEYKAIVKGMWSNLGRVIAEYPHLKTIGAKYTDLTPSDIVEKLKTSGKPAILIGAHLANWEISGATLMREGFELDVVYRPPNNPWSGQLLDKARTLNGKLQSHAKSKLGTRQLVQALQNGRSVGILIDQKYNEGIPALFFGRPAMTSPAFVKLAQKFDCALIPVRCERLNGPNFRMTFHDPLPLFAQDGEPLPTEEVIGKAHAHLESWISEHPEQWLWLHRRWSERAERDYAQLQKAA